jgi:hypothetical protein
MPDTNIVFAAPSPPPIYFATAPAPPTWPPKPATVPPLDKLSGGTRVAIGRRGVKTLTTTWGAFIEEFDDTDNAEADAIYETLCRGEVYLGGGGAQAEWTIFRAELIQPPRHSNVDWNASPIALGLATREQLDAHNHHLDVMESKTDKPSGAADFGALHVQSVLNGPWQLNGPVFPGSKRYWWLIAFNEAQWAVKREGGARRPGKWTVDETGLRSREHFHWPPRSKLLPHEKASADLMTVCEELNATGSTYFAAGLAAHSRVLARRCRDWVSLATSQMIPHAQRRGMLLEWRAARRPLWAKFHAAVAEYQRLRNELAGEA